MPIAVDAVYENGVLRLKSPVDLPDKTEVHVTIESDRAVRTPLGRQLRDLRARVLESGAPHLDWEGISEEVAARRGGWREGR
jgi:predicted DNA-binding antitoxin AbrB/MazE fold protein